MVLPGGETGQTKPASQGKGATGGSHERGQMVTNYPQHLASAAEGCGRGTSEGMAGRIMGRLGQLMCGLRGHDSVLHFEGKRVMMRCTSCGYDTPGWEINGRGPRLRYEGDAHRHLLTDQRLVLRKSA